MLDAETMPDGLEKWLNSGQTGASAQSIVAHLVGRGEQRGDYPMDGGDFTRCERLLEMVPSLRAEFHRMAEVNAYWGSLIEVWDDIKVGPDVTAAIKAIVDPIQEADPGHLPFGKNAHVRFDGCNSFKGDSKKPPMKETQADRDVSDGVYRVTANELRQFVERVERLDAEKKDIAEQIKEVMAEAKARGYDTKVMRKVIALRKRDKDDIAEEEAVLEMYREALGM
jgi:uncharacterized protein (UPF0335 family)